MADIVQILDVWKFVSGQNNTLWTYFITVTTAVVGFSFSEKFPSMSAQAKGALLVALVVFLASNAVSLYENVIVYNAAIVELAKQRTRLGSISDAIGTIPLYLVLGMHLLLDASAFAIVWHRAFCKCHAGYGN